MKRVISQLSVTILLTLFVVISCDNEESECDNCNCSNPAEKLSWLKTITSELSEYEYIMSADYKGETVFYNLSCDPTVDYASVVYDCEGENIGYLFDIRDELSDENLIWEHEESKCEFDD